MGSSEAVRAGVRRRKAARPAPTRAPRGVIAGIIVAVIVVIGLATCAVRSIVDPAPSGDEAQAAAAQTSVGANDGGISIAGSSYSTRQGDSGWELVKGEGDDATVVAQLSGSPVALCLHEGTLFVPENLSDGTWDVICYVVADGSTPAQLLNGDGPARRRLGRAFRRRARWGQPRRDRCERRADEACPLVISVSYGSKHFFFAPETASPR